MAYFVTRRHGKYLYRYELESYWDKAKQQPRQRVLRFLGRVDKEGRVIVPPVPHSAVGARAYPRISRSRFPRRETVLI